MTTERVSELVERLALRGRRLWSKDSQALRVRDVAYFQATPAATLAFVEGRAEPYKLTENLQVLNRALKGLFVQCHRSYLVAVDRVVAVFERFPEDPADPDETPRRRSGPSRSAADECELQIAGADARIPVTSTYAKGLKKALSLGSLHHVVPEHPDDKKLRKLGIIDFARRDLYKLDPKDTAAVEKFVAEWRIVKFGKERTLLYFRKFGANEIDKRRLAKSIIWQVWRWIKKGIRRPFDGNIRSFWYEVKNALGGDEILEADDIDMFYDALREMIEDQHLFRYKDFGFMDMNEYRGVGKRRPEIILAVEKAGLANFSRGLAAEAGSSYICTRGEPSVLTIEYFTDDLRAAIGDREVTLFAMTDLNPSGVSIRKNLISGLEAQGVKVAQAVVILQTTDFPDDVLPGSKAKVVRYEEKGTVITPVPPSKMSQVTKALTWFETVGDPRLKTAVEYPGGKRVVTIWGIDSDTADREMVKKRFLEGAAQVPAPRKRFPKGTSKGMKSMKCTDINCRAYLETVPPDHRHSYRCKDLECRNFNEFVPPDHAHIRRCKNSSCKSFNDFVPPDHVHQIRK